MLAQARILSASSDQRLRRDFGSRALAARMDTLRSLSESHPEMRQLQCRYVCPLFPGSCKHSTHSDTVVHYPESSSAKYAFTPPSGPFTPKDAVFDRPRRNRKERRSQRRLQASPFPLFPLLISRADMVIKMISLLDAIDLCQRTFPPSIISCQPPAPLDLNTSCPNIPVPPLYHPQSSLLGVLIAPVSRSGSSTHHVVHANRAARTASCTYPSRRTLALTRRGHCS